MPIKSAVWSPHVWPLVSLHSFFSPIWPNETSVEGCSTSREFYKISWLSHIVLPRVRHECSQGSFLHFHFMWALDWILLAKPYDALTLVNTVINLLPSRDVNTSFHLWGSTSLENAWKRVPCSCLVCDWESYRKWRVREYSVNTKLSRKPREWFVSVWDAEVWLKLGAIGVKALAWLRCWLANGTKCREGRNPKDIASKLSKKILVISQMNTLKSE